MPASQWHKLYTSLVAAPSGAGGRQHPGEPLAARMAAVKTYAEARRV